MLHNQIVLKVNPIQHDIIKAVSDLILQREGESNNHKTTSINAYSISKLTGRSYNATKKYLKTLKDL